jgi:citrate lyase subunit beta / citryl-CoA lyase
MFALQSYAPAHPRLVALTWGGEDLAAALGATDSREGGSGPFPITSRARNAYSRPAPPG